MSDKQRLEALAEGEKRKALLARDLEQLLIARKKVHKLALDSEKVEQYVEAAPRYETKADTGLCLCYALNVTANLKRLTYSIDKMIEVVKEEQKEWKTKNLYLDTLNVPKRKST